MSLTKYNISHRQDQAFYRSEYQKTLNHFSNYQMLKNEILRSPSNTIYIKIIFLLVAIMILVLFGDHVSDNMKYALLLGIGLVSIVTSLFDNHQIQKTEKLDQLKLHYENLLVCPKCKSRLINQSYTYWKEKRSCNNIKCDLEFYS